MNITTNLAKIGAESVQTVNARDLYASLKIRKVFSIWIKTQIKRAHLVVNEDYCYISSSTDAPPAGVYTLEVGG